MSRENYHPPSRKDFPFQISEALRLPLPSVPLSDDKDCIEKLSMGPPKDPLYRLLFLFRIVLEECSRNRKLAIETWLQIIEGIEGHEDLWSWEDGDEEWLRSNIDDPWSAFAHEHINPGDWEQARSALQKRLSRASNRVVISDTPRSRISIIGWKILVSTYIMNARIRRGLVPQRDSALDVLTWYSSVHELFDFPDVNHFELRATFFPALRGDVHQCTTDMSMIKDWVAMISKLYSSEQLVAICKKMCGCEACAIKMGELAYSGPEHVFGEFLSVETVPSFRADVSMSDANEGPPLSLVFSWVLYYHARLNADVEPTITPLLFYLETASVDDFLDIWSLTNDKEACLKQLLIAGSPEESYMPWINSYPKSWRATIALLQTEDWSELCDTLTTRLHDAARRNYTSRRRPLLFPEDVHIWIGSLAWIMLEDFAGLTYSSPQIWFNVWDDSEHLLTSLHLPSQRPTAISEKFIRSVGTSGHTCYSDYTQYLHWYAVMISWLQATEDVHVIPWEAADSVEERECLACIQVEALDEPLVQMRPSVDLVMLCDFLSSWSTNIDPWADPSGWIAANIRNLSWVLRQATNLTERDIPVECLMFPRFTIYVFSHLRCCGTDNKHLRALRQTLEVCRTWTNIDGFLMHQNLNEDLMKMLRQCRYHGDPFCRLPEPQSCDDQDFEGLQRIEYLDAISIYAHFEAALRNPQMNEAFLSCRGSVAQSLLNCTQRLVDVSGLNGHIRHDLMVFLVRLSRASDLHPESLVIRGIHRYGRHSVAGGSFGDVWKGVMRGDNVAIKVMRIINKGLKIDYERLKVLKKYFREAVIWRQLSHPNVLPFYGIQHIDQSRIALISPWMESGNILDYLDSFPESDRLLLIQDIASGLLYLHSLEIVHGDLKGANILITSSGRACLADLGLSFIRDDQGALLRSTNGGTAPDLSIIKDGQGTSDSTIGGTLRWQAPELLRDGIGHVENTLAIDIYAFACVCYEIYSGEIPFYKIKTDVIVSQEIIAGKRPSRPSPEVCKRYGLHEHIWDFMQRCWEYNPASRPTADQVVRFFRLWLKGPNETRPPSFPSQDLTLPSFANTPSNPS